MGQKWDISVSSITFPTYTDTTHFKAGRRRGRHQPPDLSRFSQLRLIQCPTTGRENASPSVFFLFYSSAQRLLPVPKATSDPRNPAAATGRTPGTLPPTRARGLRAEGGKREAALGTEHPSVARRPAPAWGGPRGPAGLAAERPTFSRRGSRIAPAGPGRIGLESTSSLALDPRQARPCPVRPELPAEGSARTGPAAWHSSETLLPSATPSSCARGRLPPSPSQTFCSCLLSSAFFSTASHPPPDHPTPRGSAAREAFRIMPHAFIRA